MSRVAQKRERPAEITKTHKPSLWPALYAVLAVAALHVVFILLSGKTLLSPNIYNSYARQAAAWLEGRLDLGKNVPWLELANFQGRYYVSFPPFPSYVLLPFAMLFREPPDNLVAFAVTLAGTFFAVRLAQKLEVGDRESVLLAAFLYGANNLWQITVDGWVWFFAQNLSLMLTLLSFCRAADGKKGSAFFFLCAAVGCRPFQILYAPAVCLMLMRKRKRGLRWLLWEEDQVLIPAALLAGSFLLLNFMRFGNPLEFGHNYLPEFMEAEHGQFSLTYLGENIKSLFRLPEWDPEAERLVFPQFNGVNIFLVFPLFILCLWAAAEKALRLSRGGGNALKKGMRNDLMAFSLIVLHIFLLCCHRTMGGAHFGHRYIADVTPMAFCALAMDAAKVQGSAEKRSGPRQLCFWLLFAVGLLLNFFGVLEYYR